MQTINRENFIKEVSSLLKRMKIPHVYNDGVFELMVGSESCYVQVEWYGSENEDDSVLMQFYDDGEEPLYESTEDITSIDQVEENVIQLYDFTKDKIKKLTRILGHINSIKAICEELGVEHDRFIDVVYSFESYE